MPCLPSSNAKRQRRLKSVATITQKNVVDEIIANDGLYGNDEDGYDPRVVKVVAYNNMFNGGEAWGLIYEHEDLNRYHDSPACRNPQTIWVHKSVVDKEGRNGS
jgi:hypothetical protein